MKEKFMQFVREHAFLFSTLLAAVLICVSWAVAEIANRIEASIESTPGQKRDFSAVLILVFLALVIYGAIQILIMEGRL